ncbi:transporter [Tenacibaculum sp. SG-28]|uniref:transporter n=1 Tax=Tenacibaculum sp. SG-28 TaxID=754426 RepID=UPI000CF55F6A|nr:transporter [Tenacibaculum sp. SG-28]
MLKTSPLLLCLIFTIAAYAQYTPVINSNKPGLSESPYSVGSGVYQFESTLFYRSIPLAETFSNPKSLGIDFAFRTSFLSDKLEFNLNTAIASNTIGFKNIFESTYKTTGINNLVLGAKYFIYAPKYEDKSKEVRSWKARHSFDYKRWIPHVGVYAGVNFGDVTPDYFNKGGITPKIGVLLQNEFSDKLNVITNVYYDYIGSEFASFRYILTGTYNFNNYWSGFLETEGLFGKQPQNSSLATGVAYLLHLNLQVNASLRANFEKEQSGITAGIGVSYRIDRHKDKFTEIDEFGNVIKEEEPIKYDQNRSFFGRIFGKIGNVFNKKDPREQKVDLDISPNVNETSTNKSSRKRERKESLVDIISKEDKKEKKKVAKQTKKEARKKEKELKKNKKRIEKEKEKEAKRKEKERLKLEKEIKKLEEEIKKEEEKEKKEKQKKAQNKKDN